MKIFLSLAVLATLGSAGLLFRIKHEVMALERTIHSVSAHITETQQDLNILHSELSYLTNPQRIHELVARYLPELRPLQKEQLVSTPVSIQEMGKE